MNESYIVLIVNISVLCTRKFAERVDAMLNVFSIKIQKKFLFNSQISGFCGQIGRLGPSWGWQAG